MKAKPKGYSMSKIFDIFYFFPDVFSKEEFAFQ